MPEVTNPYSNAHSIGTGPVVEPGESVEVSDEIAESLGWPLVTPSHPAKGRKADAPEVPEASTTDPAESGTQEEN